MKKTFLCTIVFVLMCMLLFVPSIAAERASLFIGDDAWENDALLPFIETKGRKLVPAEVFGEFEGIDIELSERFGSLLITGDGKYISYNLNFGRCLDESGEITECDIYRYGGAIYLDPLPVCEKFSLKFETEYAPDGYLAARISDGSETMSFIELLAIYTDTAEQEIPFLYNPEGKTVEGRFVYPYIHIPTVANVTEIISLVRGHKLTFALRPEELSGYAAVIPQIYSAGHTIAFYMSEENLADTEQFLTAMNSANEFLFALIGRTVRIYVSPENYNTIPDIEGYFKKSCRMNLVSYDLVNDWVIDITLNNLPANGVVNFILAGDNYSMANYTVFFRKFDLIDMLKTMPASEATPAK